MENLNKCEKKFLICVCVLGGSRWAWTLTPTPRIGSTQAATSPETTRTCQIFTENPHPLPHFYPVVMYLSGCREFIYIKKKIHIPTLAPIFISLPSWSSETTAADRNYFKRSQRLGTDVPSSRWSFDILCDICLLTANKCLSPLCPSAVQGHK